MNIGPAFRSRRASYSASRIWIRYCQILDAKGHEPRVPVSRWLGRLIARKIKSVFAWLQNNPHLDRLSAACFKANGPADPLDLDVDRSSGKGRQSESD